METDRYRVVVEEGAVGDENTKFCESSLGFSNTDRQANIAVSMVFLHIVLLFDCFLFLEIFGNVNNEPKEKIDPFVGVAVVVADIVLNCVYFLSNGRWRKIVCDFSKGGECYSSVLDRIVDTSLILLFLSMFLLAIAAP